MEYKQKYLSFREETNTDFLCLQIVFTHLDELLKELFDFFKDNDMNEFDSFETKTVEVNSIGEALQGFLENKEDNVKFSIPTKTLFKNSNKEQIQNSTTNVKNELIMGDKIQVGDISNNSGQVSVGKENTTKVNDSNELTQKSFNWQKWGIIIATVLTVISIVLMIILK